MAIGRAWVFGDRIDTDVLAPGWAMKQGPDALARACLTAVRPEFAREVRPGDVVVGGADFGIGSSREQAAESLKRLGVAAVLARSFARIFYRNAINLGLPALFLDAGDGIADGDRLEADPRLGRITNHSRGLVFEARAIPDNVMAIIEAGGLMAHLQKTVGRSVGGA